MADIVLLHAFPVTSALWHDQRDALRESGHRVWTPDLRGFGTGALVGDESPSLDLMAADVLALIDAEGLDQVVLAGLSMGGYVAMALLRKAPDRVAGLVLADTKGTADTPDARASRLAVAEAVVAAGHTRHLAAAMLPALLGETTRRDRPEVVATVRRWIEGADPAGVAWAQRAMAARPDSLDALGAFAGPSLLIWGDEDTVSPRSEQDLMLDAMADVELAVIPAAGHLTAVENADAVTGVLRDFLSAS